MNVPFWVWALTIGGLLVLLAIDLFIVDRKPHEISIKEAGLWVVFYVVLAILFGIGVFALAGPVRGGEFFAGYLTEYSLSIDNLFVFVIIMARFAVPAIHQHRVLLIGILLALIMRGVFIAVGAAVISQFSWVFYLFGAFLIYTAIKLLRHGGEEEEFEENVLLRWMRRVLPVTDHYVGHRMTTKIDGKWHVTPMLVVMVAIGTTDLLFALDSIPAIFGLTKEPFLVFTANAFALMGLRQLYFLIGGLLSRLIYLSTGLSAILGFIGVKLIFEALHGSGVDKIGLVPVPHITITVSLAVIIGTLAVTTITSLIAAKRHPERIREVEIPHEEEVIAE
ncbi:tellurium resistance protein TerC [Carbonactinospora thermoautotrophica]|uniref:TerC family protein n=1 Tax=Carbonactinospora thermoautotrophica TaxID=1469144 RepID=UPI0022714C46|nr:TerC family protein [Carbonactinospora thermoautotrophica]MCX9191128.1 tellurium resistance protein TerC [Carbonactinospora thermoautotrophica]